MDDLREWRVVLSGRALSPWTLHGHLRATRRLFKWLYLEGEIESNPTESLKLPRLPMEARKGIAYDDMRRMLDSARAHHPRDYALLSFLADTAARIGGASGLRLSDVDLTAGRAIVREIARGVLQAGDIGGPGALAQRSGRLLTTKRSCVYQLP